MAVNGARFIHCVPCMTAMLEPALIIDQSEGVPHILSKSPTPEGAMREFCAQSLSSEISPAHDHHLRHAFALNPRTWKRGMPFQIQMDSLLAIDVSGVETGDKPGDASKGAWAVCLPTPLILSIVAGIIVDWPSVLFVSFPDFHSLHCPATILGLRLAVSLLDRSIFSAGENHLDAVFSLFLAYPSRTALLIRPFCLLEIGLG